MSRPKSNIVSLHQKQLLQNCHQKKQAWCVMGFNSCFDPDRYENEHHFLEVFIKKGTVFYIKTAYAANPSNLK
jgi:hypothetical protein